jgi:hypothetical protein
VDVPTVVPSIITSTDGSGWPFSASVTRPAIFPLAPAKRDAEKHKRTDRDKTMTFLMAALLLYVTGK